MRCAEIQEQLSLYDYGGLGWIGRWRLRRHLARCPKCAREWAALQRTVEMLAAVPDRPVPADLWEGVGRAIAALGEPSRAPEAAPRPRARSWKWVPAGAAVAVLILVGIGWFGSGSAPPEGALEDPGPFLRYHHLLAQQEVLAEAASLEVLAAAVSPRNRTWEQEG